MSKVENDYDIQITDLENQVDEMRRFLWHWYKKTTSY